MVTLGDGCYGRDFKQKGVSSILTPFFTSNDADYQNGGSSSFMTEFV
jgi:hypothetical protein